MFRVDLDLDFPHSLNFRMQSNSIMGIEGGNLANLFTRMTNLTRRQGADLVLHPTPRQ